MSNQPNTAPIHNVLNWFEIPVTDLGASTALYEAMLDTKLAQVAGAMPMAILSNADHSCVSGCLIASSERTSPGGTVVYLNAKDGVRACLSRAVEAGAKVVKPATVIGPHGTIALIEDVDGNVVGLHEEPVK